MGTPVQLRLKVSLRRDANSKTSCEETVEVAKESLGGKPIEPQLSTRFLQFLKPARRNALVKIQDDISDTRQISLFYPDTVLRPIDPFVIRHHTVRVDKDWDTAIA